MGYYLAGFDVVGVDVAPQPHYPFEFVQADALTVAAGRIEERMAHFPLWGGFDAIHASPPCQPYSTLRTVAAERERLIEQTRSALQSTGLPYVIENVVGAPLVNYVTLCGTAFGLVDGDAELQRHRRFETSFTLWNAPPCAHSGRRTLGVYGHLAVNDRPNNPTDRPGGSKGWKAGRDRARRLMGIGWEVTDTELAEAIPPAYTEWIGGQLIDTLT
jgi:DNA (cytosine-5)-methyltransferase 1